MKLNIDMYNSLIRLNNKMNKFMDDVEKILVTLIPFILFSGIPPYLIPIALCVPLILKKLIKLIEYFCTKNHYTFTIYEYSYSNYTCVKNKYYDIIGFAISKDSRMHNIKKTVCYETKHPNGLKDEVTMTILPANETQFIFQHDNFIVEIQSSENCISEKNSLVNKCFIINAKSEENLVQFKKYLCETRKEYFMSLDSTKYKHMTFVDKRQKEWIPKNINVIKTFDNVFFDKNIKNEIKTNIDNFYQNTKLYEKFGIPRKIGFIFYGIPGTGKSSTIYAIANTYDMNIYPINLNCTPENFIEQINEIKERSIVLFEDIDTISITHSRKTNNENNCNIYDDYDIIENNTNKSDKEDKDNKENKENIKKNLLLGALLEILDGYRHLNNCIVIMTTNHYEKLDGALIRPGRIDHHYEFKSLNKEVLVDIIKYFYDVDINILDNTLDHIKYENITTAELINSIILPNINNYEKAMTHLLTK